MSSGSAPPPAPDYSGLQKATEAQLAFEKDAWQQSFDWAKNRYDDQLPFLKQSQETALSGQQFSLENAKKDRARWEELYQPVENKLVSDAENYDSPEKEAQARAQAEATVGQQFDAADAAAERQLGAYNVNPGSLKSGALNLSSKLSRAASGVAASEGAAKTVKDTGLALRTSVANMGRGYPGSVNQSTGTSTGAGTGAAGISNQTTGTYAGSLGNPTAYAGMMNGTLGQWGNNLNSQYANQIAGYNAQQNSSSGAGSALGMIGGIGMSMLMAADGAYIGDDPDADSDYDAAGATAAQDPDADSGEYVDQSPSNGAVQDDVPAQGPDGRPILLDDGEFVLPKRTVDYYGKKGIEGIIAKADKAMGLSPQPIGPKFAQPTPAQQPSAMMAGGGAVRRAGSEAFVIPSRRQSAMGPRVTGITRGGNGPHVPMPHPATIDTPRETSNRFAHHTGGPRFGGIHRGPR